MFRYSVVLLFLVLVHAELVEIEGPLDELLLSLQYLVFQEFLKANL